jgi:hypothetical protein
MKENYKKYPDLIFMDTNLKHKIPLSTNNSYNGYGSHNTKVAQENESELTMILISGINSDGKSVLFAWGFCKDQIVDSYTWFFNKFITYMAEDSLNDGLAMSMMDN